MQNDTSIHQVIKGCIAGNRRCQRDLVMMSSDTLYTVALRYMRDTNRAQDIVQDSYIKIFKSIHTFDQSRGTAMGWMRRIVINTAIKALRKHKYTYDIETISTESYESLDPEIVQQLQAEDVLQVVQSLSPMYRQVFNLAVIDGYSHKEIGTMLGISDATSRTNLARAKSAIRKKLDNLENNDIWVKAK